MIKKIIEKLEDAETKFFASTFLAPLVRGGLVRTRIAGIVHTFRVAAGNFEGWAIFRPRSFKEAEVVEEASLRDVANYLKRFPILRVILAEKKERFWIACPMNVVDAKQRFRIKEFFLPCGLVQGAMQFEQIVARFDGATFWFEGADEKRDPRISDALREALKRLHRPEALRIKTLTLEERMAYAYAFGLEMEARKNMVEDRLQHALNHSGAKLVRYMERGEELVVTWREQRELTTTVRKDNLTVVSAGICLSGEDRKFDLTSLVSVVREDERKGQDYVAAEDDD